MTMMHSEKENSVRKKIGIVISNHKCDIENK